jgi:hypothetical protein
VNLRPLTPGVDPTPQQYALESFVSEIFKWGDAVDCFLPNDFAAVVKESMQKSERLGINCGQTIDRLVRQAIYRAYLGGNANAVVAAGAGAGAIHISSLNGFTEINGVTDNRPVAVSAANPLTITFGLGLEPANTVVGFAPDDPAEPFGPGWITLGAVLTVGVAAREAVLAANRSLVIYAGGGNSVDAIVAADVLTMADLINATTQLRAAPAPVPGFGGGLYHAHLPVAAEGQLLLDPMVRGIIHTGDIPAMYADAAIGRLGGALLLRNAMCPDAFNVDQTSLVSTGAGASIGSPEIGADVVNNAGVRIGYTMVYGQGFALEQYIPTGTIKPDESISTQNAMPAADSSGVSIDVDRAEIVVRPPIDRHNEMTSLAWKLYAGWPIPSDITTQARRFRRAAIIAHAIP